MMSELVALCGYPGSGKDAAAEWMVRHYGFQRVAFADPLKELLLEIDPSYHSLGDLEYQKRNHKRHTREKLQRLGMALREADRLYWIRKVENRILGILQEDEDARIVVTDTRFANEADALELLGFEIVAIDRPGFGPVNDHESERGTEVVLGMSVRTVDNVGTVEDLAREIVHPNRRGPSIRNGKATG